MKLMKSIVTIFLIILQLCTPLHAGATEAVDSFQVDIDREWAQLYVDIAYLALQKEADWIAEKLGTIVGIVQPRKANTVVAEGDECTLTFVVNEDDVCTSVRITTANKNMVEEFVALGYSLQPEPDKRTSFVITEFTIDDVSTEEWEMGRVYSELISNALGTPLLQALALFSDVGLSTKVMIDDFLGFAYTSDMSVTNAHDSFSFFADERGFVKRIEYETKLKAMEFVFATLHDDARRFDNSNKIYFSFAINLTTPTPTAKSTPAPTPKKNSSVDLSSGYSETASGYIYLVNTLYDMFAGMGKAQTEALMRVAGSEYKSGKEYIEYISAGFSAFLQYGDNNKCIAVSAMIADAEVALELLLYTITDSTWEYADINGVACFTKYSSESNDLLFE